MVVTGPMPRTLKPLPVDAAVAGPRRARSPTWWRCRRPEGKQARQRPEPCRPHRCIRNVLAGRQRAKRERARFRRHRGADHGAGVQFLS